MQVVTPIIHVPDVRGACEWYVRLGASAVRTHSDVDAVGVGA